MSSEIVMPNLGFDAQTATLLEWLVEVGSPVKRGDAIALVESDKAQVELEALTDGILLKHIAEAGDAVPIGNVIGIIGQPNSTYDANATAKPKVNEARITPVAQRVAENYGVDISNIKGSGSGGKITRRDVESQISPLNEPSSTAQNAQHNLLALPKVRKAAREQAIRLEDVRSAGNANPIRLADLDAFKEKTTPAATEPISIPDGTREIPQSRMRQTIGKRLATSMQEAPHFYVTGEFDLEPALKSLEKQPKQATLNDLIQYVTVQTLLATPTLNATFTGNRLYHHEAVHLSIAVALEDGLLTPTIPNAQHYSLTGLAEISRDVIQRARKSRLQPTDLQPGTFTISNLGIVKQVDQFTAVINPPQVAILAVGRVKQRPFVIDGGLHIRHTVHLTLSGDHRAVDGMDLAQFMKAFQQHLDEFSR
jgi:pyruvate dehydrogenase E2 component (dihydrolipoamide acetyltransferase)